MNKPPLTQEYLKSILHYNPETGVFTWISDRGNQYKSGMVAGTISPEGYLRISIFRKQHYAQRLAVLYMEGFMPDVTDHENRNRIDNRWCNIRVATIKQNNQNQGLRKDNTSGVKGVGWSKSAKKWRAYIGVNGKTKQIGVFSNFDEAVNAANAERKKEYGDFFPGEMLRRIDGLK